MRWFNIFTQQVRPQHDGLAEDDPAYVALLEIMAIAMMADRHVSLQERDAITSLLRRLAPQQPHPSEHLINQSVRTARELLGAQALEREAALATIASKLSPELRQTAYRAALIIVRADDEVVPQESRTLLELRTALELSAEQAQRIADAL